MIKQSDEPNPLNLSDAHSIFAREMINGRRQTEAYIMAYPGSTQHAAYSSASRLMENVELKQYIEEGIRKKRAERLAADRKMLRDKIHRFQEDWDELRKIIKTGTFRDVTNKNKGKDVIEKRKDDPVSRVRALALNLKYQAAWDQLLAEARRLDLLILPEEKDADTFPIPDDIPELPEEQTVAEREHADRPARPKGAPLSIYDCGESEDFLGLLAEAGYDENFKNSKKT